MKFQEMWTHKHLKGKSRPGLQEDPSLLWTQDNQLKTDGHGTENIQSARSHTRAIFQSFHPDTAKAMHLQGQDLWSGELDPARQARFDAKRAEQAELQREVVENQAEVLTFLQAGMQDVPDADVKAASFLWESNMMELRQFLKRKYAEGMAFGMDEIFEKTRTDIATARAANLESQRLGAENTKRFKPAIIPPNLWPEDLQAKLENGLFFPLRETAVTEIQSEKQYLQRYLNIKHAINNGENPFASELLAETQQVPMALVLAWGPQQATPCRRTSDVSLPQCLSLRPSLLG